MDATRNTFKMSKVSFFLDFLAFPFQKDHLYCLFIAPDAVMSLCDIYTESDHELSESPSKVLSKYP